MYIRTVLSFVAVAFLLVAPASASERSDAFASVQQFVDALNKNDSPGMNGRVTTTLDIIDDLPPYHWFGPTALQDWGRDVDAYMKGESATDPIVKLSRATYAGVVGTNAYFVVPAVYSYQHQHRRVQQNGIITTTLRKTDQGWLVTAFAWTRR